MRTGRLLVLVGAAVLATAGAGTTAPAPFRLVFDGKHNAALFHEGTFTTSSSWCPSGTAADLDIDGTTETATRKFTCSGGGDFTATIAPVPSEHGGSGSWRIVGGSGPLGDLRGKGTFTSTLLTGSPSDPSTITFRSTWAGAADFDVDPPALAVTSARARKLKRPKQTYTLRLVLSLADAAGGPVDYALEIVDPKRPFRPLVDRVGSTTTPAVRRSFRIRVSKTTRAVRLKLGASDAVGNEARLARTIRLR